MVARRGRLPGLRPELRRRERRRDRRPRRRPGAAAVPARPRRRRPLVQPVVPVAAGRHGLRHRRLPGDRSGVRDARGGRGADRRGARARDPHDRRHRPEPRLEPASVVPRGARLAAGLAGAGALLVPARDAARTASCRRTAGSRSSAARRGRARRGRRVVPPPLRARAARSQLDAPRRLGRARGHPSLLVRPRRRRRADRLGGAARQGSGARRGDPGDAAPRRAPVHGPRHAARDLPRAGGAIADSYAEPRVLVGEIWLPDAERFARYLRPDELHTAFNFDFLACPWEPAPDAHVDRDRARRARSRSTRRRRGCSRTTT